MSENNTNPSVVRASKLAEKIHSTQKDKAGESYYDGHILDVVRRLPSIASYSMIEAAYLHDSIEDSNTTPLSLYKEGVSQEAINLVIELTHRVNEPREGYIGRLSKEALIIKAADNQSNGDPERLERITDPEVRERLRAKYSRESGWIASRLREFMD